MTGLYILDEQNRPVLVDDVLTWAQWFETHDRRVAFDEMGSVHVSTIFVGLDMNYARYFTERAVPILWETMIFGGPHDRYQERYSSYWDAVEGHKRATRLAFDSVPAVFG